MSGPSEIEVTSGSPTPEEAEAARLAILALWREDQTAAARAAGGTAGWVRAARQEATGADASGVRAWRAAAGLTQRGTLGARRVGRGDTR